MIRHDKLKEEMAPITREKAKKRRRTVNEECFIIKDGAICPHVLMWQRFGHFYVKKTCTIKRCPKEETK